MDPRVRFQHRVQLARKAVSVAAWVEAENAKGHTCACGCGQPITIRPVHHSQGIPHYIHTHHPMATTREVHALREAGLLTAPDVAHALGIGETTLRRLEGKLFEPVPRQGQRQMRVFTPEQVEVLRKALREKTWLGPTPELLRLSEVARRAGCSTQTIRTRLGTELPSGRKLTQGPRALWGFPGRGEADRHLGEEALQAEDAARRGENPIRAGHGGVPRKRHGFSQARAGQTEKAPPIEEACAFGGCTTRPAGRRCAHTDARVGVTWFIGLFTI